MSGRMVGIVFAVSMEGCSWNRDLKGIAERVLTSFRSPRVTNFAKDARFQLVIVRLELFSDLEFQYIFKIGTFCQVRIVVGNPRVKA
jgi:hypothetical protein